MSAASLSPAAGFRAAFATRIVRDSGWMLTAQSVRIAAQAGYFVLAAHALGVTEFGRLAAALAIAAVAVPFAACGSGNLIIRDVVANEQSFAAAWGSALLMTVGAGSSLIVVSVAFVTVALPQIPIQLMLLVAVSDMLFARFTDSCSQAFQGFRNIRATAVLLMLPAVCRVAAAAGFALTAESTAANWACWYLGASCVCSLLAVAYVLRRLGSPAFDLSRTRHRLGEGLFFAVGLSSETVYGDIDKTMLSRLSTLGSTGVYAAASRIVAIAFIPVYAVLQASYHRFFAHGAAGIESTVQFARRLAIPFALAGVMAAACLWVAAPVAPWVLGKEFSVTTDAIRWMCVVPLLQAAYYLAGDTLTGAGFQRERSLFQAGVAVMNIALNVILIPEYGWRAAAWVTILSDAVLAVTLWLTVARLLRRSASGAG